MKIANFLDCSFNLEKGTFCPYKKPNNTLLYIRSDSNHPPNITKQLPKMIEKRLSELSCNEQEFIKSKDPYEKALNDSGYKHKFEYLTSNPRRRTRSRTITWFNPPFNAAVTTNIGKQFLSLINKHFPSNNKYSKIFNRNTVKLSYSCTPNIKSIITSHNKRVTNGQDTATTRPCNCKKYICPLNGECRNSAVIYKATIETQNAEKQKEYIGMSETEFKLRFYNHESSFKNFHHRSKTTLSQYVWRMKEEGEPYQIKWNLLSKARPYICGTRKCDLCISEKFEIIKSSTNRTLNKRTEIANKCKHRAKFKLKNFK